MRQSSWFKSDVSRLRAPRQHGSTILFGISVAGTIFATAFLLFDGWVDALAIYAMSGLMLILFLSRLTRQQAELQSGAAVGTHLHVLGEAKPGLVFGRAPRA